MPRWSSSFTWPLMNSTILSSLQPNDIALRFDRTMLGIGVFAPSIIVRCEYASIGAIDVRVDVEHLVVR